MNRVATILALLVVLLVSCGPTSPTRETSGIMHEHGRVKQLAFAPGYKGKIEGAIGFNGGKHGGMTWSPSRNVVVDPSKSIVFECPHGTFDVNDRPDVWQKLHEGDEVEISYREVYEVRNGDDGRPARKLVDLEFVDADPVRDAAGVGKR